MGVSEREDSNFRPQRPERCALPTALRSDSAIILIHPLQNQACRRRSLLLSVICNL